jgi:hypothetical protein
MAAAKTITANFVSNILKVNNNNPGMGSISIVPGGINCTTSCKKKYKPGTVVTLTAIPAKDKTFIGWAGACSGNKLTCTITLKTNKSVSASFGL